MQSYLNPKVVTIPNPTGLDACIADCQAAIGALPWLQTVFGRAIQQREAAKQGSDIIFPETWGKNREPFNCMPNDNVTAQAFFISRDPGTFPNYDRWDAQTIIVQPLSCILWADLKKIDPVKKFRFSETLKTDVVAALKKLPFVRLVNIYEEWDRVFSPFTITANYKQYLKPPYWGFRVDFDASYPQFAENC